MRGEDDGTSSAMHARIAELEQRQRVLEAELAVLRRVQAALPDLVALKDERLRFVHANEAFCAFYGKPLEAIVGATESALGAPDEAARHAEQDGQVLATGIIVNIPSEVLLRHDGVQAHFHTIRCPLRDGAGRVTAVLTCSRAIQADAHVTAQGSRPSDAHNELLLRIIPDMYFRIHRDGTYLDFSAAKGSDTALPAAFFLGKKMQDVTPDLAGPVLACAEAALRTGEMQTLEFKMYVHGGFVDYEARILVSGPDEILAIVRDIAAQKRVEERLREAEARFRSLEEQSMFGIFMVQDGKLVYASPGFAALFGYTRDEVLALARPLDLVATEDRGVVTRLFDALGQPVEGASRPGIQSTFRGERKGGARIYIDAYSAATSWSGKPAVIGVMMDVTSRRRAEEEQRRLQEEVIRIQSTMMEELSTPLIPISDRIVVMPIVGTLDEDRAHRMIERLLSGVVERRAAVAILDITGMRSVSMQTAGVLVRCAQAVRLLGARVLLTGIRADVAQTLVAMDVDLGGVATLATLQAGIAHAMKL